MSSTINPGYPLYIRLLILSCLSLVSGPVRGQRNYSPHSVLASGNWYRMAVSAPGVYKADLPFLASLGLSGPLPSAAIRLYGNGGGMLPEAASAPKWDDLREADIRIVDGGDGMLDGSDYFLFYAPGPHHWLADSAARRFVHRKNLYDDRAYYYISIGGTGRRIAEGAAVPPAPVTVTTFDERYFHELDSVNFLSSGREWWGEEFAASPGRSLSRSFALPLPDLVPGSSALLETDLAARSAGTPSVFRVDLNGQPVQQVAISPVGTGTYDLFARRAEEREGVTVPAGPPVLTFTYAPGSFNSQGWINWFRFFARRRLVLPTGGQLSFRDWGSVGHKSVDFRIAGAAGGTVWDVTDPTRPVQMSAAAEGDGLRFSADARELREYICFGTGFLSPQPVGRVASQDLHGAPPADYLIVTDPEFRGEAERLALFHRQRGGLRVLVATTEQVYHEFSGGTPDPTAIRDFVKMFYDRQRADWNGVGKYLLLLGKASFDYKDRIRSNTNRVPAYETPSSLDPLSTYTSDDFFGFLEDHEDIHSGLVVNDLDVGIGRVPARSAAEVRAFIDKVYAYHASAALGPWRNNLDFVADDEDNNLHLQDAEQVAATAAATNPLLNLRKIYLDAFRQEGSTGGGKYPGANAVINGNIFSGTLVWNYSGHGGPQRLAEEVVLDRQIVANWNNAGRLPLFITATCDFAPYDLPYTPSMGEELLLREKTGAIALMTTTRLVFAFSNRIMNNNYIRIALERDSSGRHRTLGEAVRDAKNLTYRTSGDVTNNRKFALLGDPAMTLAFPQYELRVTRINGKDIAAAADTLNAMEKVRVEGEVTDAAGGLQGGFSGTAHLTVFDKPRPVQTLANDPTSQPVSFPDQSDVLFRGKATVQGGRFAFEFRLPRDLNYQFGSGRLSLYAQNGLTDGAGYSDRLVVGGISSGVPDDKEGPQIRAYLNDERFVPGGLANPAPVLLVKLSDSSGINTAGTGIGHDLIATLDGDNRTYYVLNNFYESELDSYQQGTVRFQLPELAPGPHSLTVRAWDMLNNSAEYTLEFTVAATEDLRIDHVLNYPNPFTTRTSFFFEHNQPATDLQVKVDVFTVSGKRIKTLTRTINTPGNRSNEVEWDGRDDWGNRVGRGVYIYRLVVSGRGKKAEKWERLVVLR